MLVGRGPSIGRQRLPTFVRHNGEKVDLDCMRQHMSDILSGMYSLGGLCDQALIQQRIRLHPAFAAISYKGMPDIRVILYRNEPAMAMLRLPTKESNGRANLHQGGIGTGVDLETGVTHHAVQRNRFVEIHPDTKLPVVGMQVPYWSEVLADVAQGGQGSGPGIHWRGYCGGRAAGPMLLEANARPGLAIQIANSRGLLPRLQAIDDLHRQAENTPEEPVIIPLEAVRQSRMLEQPLSKSA